MSCGLAINLHVKSGVACDAKGRTISDPLSTHFPIVRSMITEFISLHSSEIDRDSKEKINSLGNNVIQGLASNEFRGR